MRKTSRPPEKSGNKPRPQAKKGGNKEDKKAGEHWKGGKGRQGAKDGKPQKNYLYGIHAVEAALLNPNRKIQKVYTTPNAAERLDSALGKSNILPIEANPRELDTLLGDQNLVHQGAVAEVSELPTISEDKLLECSKILVLDQITDPHNVGAIIRSAAAFGVDAIVLTRHHTPPLTGIVSKTACGGLDLLNIHLASNLARCLKNLAKSGFAIYGLDSEASESLEDQTFYENVVLVMGAEDKGLRRLTRENCDKVCAIQTSKNNALASLNVSNAAAIALHTVLVNAK